MRNYEERAKDFIKMLFPLIEDCEDVWEFREAVDMFNRTYSRKVICSNGLARIAFISSDYVVKYEYDAWEVGVIGGCENEMELYAQAEEEGFAYLFAKITPFHYCGRDFYIMPRVYGVGNKYGDYADDYMTHAEIEFCRNHDVTDLHCNNFGFRNGHVCVIDYACREN